MEKIETPQNNDQVEGVASSGLNAPFAPGTLVWQEYLTEQHPYHELANTFPRMDEEEFAGLVASIKDAGLLKDILTFHGAIVDGRHRFEACLGAGIEPKFLEFQGTEEQLEKVVFAENFQRRNLSKEQRQDLAVTLRKMKWTQVRIAIALGVSEGIVNKWLKLKLKSEDEETSTNTRGQERPTSYQKNKKPESEDDPETAEQKLAEEALEEIKAWAKTYEKLGYERLKSIIACVI